MLVLTICTIPSAACSSVRPVATAIRVDRRRARHRRRAASAAEEVVGVDAAEHDVRVGDGRLGAALAVADGRGVGARALRADAQRAARVEPGDRAAAGADREDLDHRREHRPAVGRRVLSTTVTALPFAITPMSLLVPPMSSVTTFGVSICVGQRERADDAAAGPGHDRAHRPLAGGAGRHHAAVGLHHEQVASEAALLQLARQAVEVGGDDRHVAALTHVVEVRSNSRHSGATSDDRQTVSPAAPRQDLADAALVLRVRVGVQEADADRLDAASRSRAAASRTLVPRRAASSTSPVWRMRSRTSSRSARGTSGAGLTCCRSYMNGLFVRMISSTSRKPAVVIRPVRGSCICSSALSTTVAPCTNVSTAPRSAGACARGDDLVGAGEDPLGEVARRGRRLVHVHVARLVHEHEVRERPADVRRQPVAHTPPIAADARCRTNGSSTTVARHLDLAHRVIGPDHRQTPSPGGASSSGCGRSRSSSEAWDSR